MFVIAVTGGIGAGKTEAVRRLESHGAFTLDLDTLAKDVLDAESGIRDAVVAAFGEGILDDEGAIVRSRLADEAFRCDATAATLGEIVHPTVIARVSERLQDLALQARPPSVVAMEVPLLAENPVLRREADLVLTVEAPEEARVSRLLTRGMDEEDARRRISTQVSDEARRAIADAILVNDASLGEFVESVDGFWEREVAPRVA